MNGPRQTTRREACSGALGTIPMVVTEAQTTPKGTALVLHGRNGAPDQAQIAAISAAYLARGWRIVAPELPNSAALPASGPPNEVTMSRHRRASEQVGAFAASRWAGERMVVAGHSLGAYAAAFVACESPHIEHVLAVSPATSGLALLNARRAMGPAAVAELERDAPLMRTEMEAEDAAPALADLPAAVAVVSGELDGLVTLETARAYFSAAQNGRFFASLPGHHHCPAGPDVDAALAAALVALDA